MYQCTAVLDWVCRHTRSITIYPSWPPMLFPGKKNEFFILIEHLKHFQAIHK